MMNKDPKTRVGVKSKNEIKSDPFFAGLDWDKLLKKELSPPNLNWDNEEDEDDINRLINKPDKVD
jgi:hypothetical protein